MHTYLRSHRPGSQRFVYKNRDTTQQSPDEIMEIIAHRGACYKAPENSLEAFEVALQQGATRLELDVQLTRDGVPVVHHDETTERTGDIDLRVVSSTAEELASVRLENGEPIPSFEDVCKTFAGRCTLDVELKDTRPEIGEKILDILERYNHLEDALLTSFDSDVLRSLRDIGYEGRTGLVVGSTSLSPRQRLYETWPVGVWKDIQATDLVMHHRLIHPPLSNAIEEAEGNVILWMSMDDEQESLNKRSAWYQRMQRLQPDGVIVGRIEEALRHIEPTLR